MKKCFAESLGNCDPKMSKEHYLSDGILKLIDGGPFIAVKGRVKFQGVKVTGA